MPLLPLTISAGITSTLTPLIEAKSKTAFYLAMKKFQEECKKGGTNDVFDRAASAASVVFSANMTPLAVDIGLSVAQFVDVYTRAITVTIPPGQVVTGVAGTFPVVAATTTPSVPGIIL